MNKISEAKEKHVLTVGLVRISGRPGEGTYEILNSSTIEHMSVMLTTEESEAWYKMVKAIVEAQVKEKNKQWKGN